MIPTIIIGVFALCGLIAWAVVRGGSDRDETEPSEYESDWTGSADPVTRWGYHRDTGYPAFSDDETQAKSVETRLGVLRKGDR